MSTDNPRNAVPGHQEYMNPTLEVLRSQQKPLSNEELEDAVAAAMSLSAEVLSVPRSDKNSQPEAHYRMAWARTYLKKVGLINNPNRGAWEITQRGREAGSIDPKEIARQVQSGADADALAAELPDHFVEELLALCPEAVAERGVPEGEALAACYARFRQKFGPNALSALEGEDLLTTMHGRGTKDSLVYWLEFKDDEELPYVFGSIAGGSALKFKIYQNIDTGQWMTGSPTKQERLSKKDAIELVRKQRSQLLAGCDVLEEYAKAPENTDYKALQAEMVAAAPDLAETAWGHKYFSLLFSEILDDYHAVGHQQFHLLRLHKLPTDKRYENARFFAGIARQLDIPTTHLLATLNKRDGSPRKSWRLRLDPGAVEEQWPAMRDGGYVAVDWNDVGDLSPVQAGTAGRLHVRGLVEEHYPDEPKNAGLQLYRFAVRAEERELVAVMGEKDILGVGLVSGEYFYSEDHPSHRLPVRWLSLEQWRLPKRESQKKKFAWLKALPNRLQLERVADAPESPPLPKAGQDSPAKKTALPALHGVQGRIEAVLKRKKQVILYGPPGTGKTYWAEHTVRELAARSWFGSSYGALSQEDLSELDGKAIERCCFHPAYGYEDFVIGYRPALDDGTLVFRSEKGVFARVCERALAEPKRNYYVLVDEINRGDIPRIFGELLLVLEGDKRGLPVTLPISGERLVVPGNVYLVGTMNTADRSVALLDAALRRRFGFIELMPDVSVLGTASVQGIPLGPWLEDLNRKVLQFAGRDSRSLQVGHSYLLSGEEPIQDFARLAEVLRDDIIPLLQEYCYEDFKALARILGKQIVQEDKQRIDESLFDLERRDDLISALLVNSESITATTTAAEGELPGDDVDEVDDEDDVEEEDGDS